jgi:phospholipid N-methyltransferase
LEIGPGRGCWTKAIFQLNPKSITCIDALSAAHNQFWKYVGSSEKITYHQIKDFSLDCIQNNSIDFVFSFGTFCHISPIMIYEYFKSIYKKLRPGAEGFVMYADYDKYNKCAEKYHTNYHWDKQNDLLIMQQKIKPTWYHMGIERAQQTLLELGYEVITADTNVNERDPVIHFRKK